MLGVGPEMFKYLGNQINSCNWLYLIKSNGIAIFDTCNFLPKFSLLHCLPVNVWARRWRIPCPEWEKAKKQVLQTKDGQTNTTIASKDLAWNIFINIVLHRSPVLCWRTIENVPSIQSDLGQTLTLIFTPSKAGPGIGHHIPDQDVLKMTRINITLFGCL